MFDMAVASQIAILVQVSIEMELMVHLHILLVVIQFVDRKVCTIEGSGSLVETIEAIDVTLRDLQSCPTLCDPLDGSPLGSPVPGILQARILEWVAISIIKSIFILIELINS